MPDYYTDPTVIRTTKWKVADARIDPTQMENFAKLAYETINTYLGKKYDVPFEVGASTPGAIKEISDLLTIYYGKLYTGGHAGGTDALEMFRDEAFRLLELLADGELKIDGVVKIQLLDSTTRDYHPTMILGDVEDARPDSDRLSDEEDQYTDSDPWP